MKRFKRLALIASLFLLLFNIQVKADEKDNKVETTQIIVVINQLNIRTTPNTNIQPFDSVSFRTTLYAVDGCLEQGWTAILYNNQVKFVSTKYTTLKTDYQQNKEKYSKTYLGQFTITHYCSCSKCCGKWAGGNTASGTKPVAGKTVACGSLPFGTKVEVNGHVYTVEDRGVNGNWIDIYCDSHSEALNRGMYTTSVYLVN